VSLEKHSRAWGRSSNVVVLPVDPASLGLVAAEVLCLQRKG
jgi:hypothetical protein